jgi:hypothetical protein
MDNFCKNRKAKVLEDTFAVLLDEHHREPLGCKPEKSDRFQLLLPSQSFTFRFDSENECFNVFNVC